VPATQRFVRNGVYWMREALVPGLAFNPKLQKGVQKLAEAHLRKQVTDPELREKVMPDYTIGCKRILPSNEWYPALQQPNVELETSGIREVREHSIVTGDGTEVPVDVIIFGTGFHVTDIRMGSRVRGRGGRTLDDVWQGSPQAYRGTTVSGFPNLFVLLGPNTGLGHNSVVFMTESQINYVTDAMRVMRDRGIESVDVLPAAYEGYNDRIQKRLTKTTWMSGCSSWYLTADGFNASMYPGFATQYLRQMRDFRFDDYAAVAHDVRAGSGARSSA